MPKSSPKSKFVFNFRFSEQTLHSEDGFPEYKRPNNGRNVLKRGRGGNVTSLDNRYVVPYNPALLVKYNCHINIEVVCSVRAVKYLYKYITKGCDRLSVALSDGNRDAIQQYLDCRYIGPQEAYWRLFEYELCGNSHTVCRLPVHLEDQQRV